MAKTVNKTDEQFANVEESLSKAGLYVVKNQNVIMKLVGIILIIVFLFIGYTKFYIEPLEKEASEEMYIAEFYFQNNDFDKALNGDGQFSGFISIVSDYSSTDAANLANYYAAICQINLGEYENAINSLNEFSTDDVILSALSTGLIGDANMELENVSEALNYYVSAANDNENSFTTPYFMMKQAGIHNKNEDYASALKIYNSIKSDYPKSTQALSIDKYISSESNR